MRLSFFEMLKRRISGTLMADADTKRLTALRGEGIVAMSASKTAV